MATIDKRGQGIPNDWDKRGGRKGYQCDQNHNLIKRWFHCELWIVTLAKPSLKCLYLHTAITEFVEQILKFSSFNVQKEWIARTYFSVIVTLQKLSQTSCDSYHVKNIAGHIQNTVQFYQFLFNSCKRLFVLYRRRLTPTVMGYFCSL